MWRIRFLVCLVLGLSTAVVAPQAPASADAPATSSEVLSMRGDPSDWVTRGDSAVFSSAEGTFSAGSLTPSHIEVGGRTADGTDAYLDVNVGNGSVLHDGLYGELRYTQQLGPRVAESLNVSIAYNQRRCEDTNAAEAGSITIKDIASTADAITRLDMVFDLHCGDSTAAAFGELQINEPQQKFPAEYDPDFVVSDSTIQWPDTDPRVRATSATVTFFNTGASPLEFSNAARLEGSGSQAFEVANDTCESQDTDPGQSCSYTIDFEQGGAGVARAELDTVPDGLDVPIELIGPATDGDTELDIDSSSLTNGTTVTSTLENDGPFSVYGGDSYVDFRTTGGIDATLRATRSQVLRGTFTTTNDNQTLTPQFTLSYGGTTCDTMHGTVTVFQLASDPLDGSIIRFDAAFRQYCDGSSAVRGRLRFDATTAAESPTVVYAPPTKISYGSVVDVHGRATPNAPVTVLAAPRGTSDYAPLARVMAGTDGTFVTTYKATADHRIAAQQPAERNSSRMVQSGGAAYLISPRITAVHRTLRRHDAVFSLSGTTNPHHELFLIIHPLAGGAGREQRVKVSPDGHWSTTLARSWAVRAYVREATVETASTVVTLRPR